MCVEKCCPAMRSATSRKLGRPSSTGRGTSRRDTFSVNVGGNGDISFWMRVSSESFEMTLWCNFDVVAADLACDVRRRVAAQRPRLGTPVLDMEWRWSSTTVRVRVATTVDGAAKCA